MMKKLYGNERLPNAISELSRGRKTEIKERPASRSHQRSSHAIQHVRPCVVCLWAGRSTAARVQDASQDGETFSLSTDDCGHEGLQVERQGGGCASNIYSRLKDR
jgi:hypothetical protein